MNDKTPAFNPPRIYDDKILTDQEYQKVAAHKLPDWVICYRCRKPPEGTNWLKPVSNDPNCKRFIHLGCMDDQGDTLRQIQEQSR